MIAEKPAATKSVTKKNGATEAFSEDNLLIFSAGLLCGSLAPGCNRTILTTVSPLTGLLAFSMMGGFWAPELKYAGWDKVILKGRSPRGP